MTEEENKKTDGFERRGGYQPGTKGYQADRETSKPLKLPEGGSGESTNTTQTGTNKPEKKE